MTETFYGTNEWIKLRSKVKAKWKRDNKPCGFCGKEIDWSIKGGVITDHIKNRRQYPHLALDESNCQILHHGCNTRKASWVENSSKTPTNSSGFPSGSEWDDG